MSKPILAFLVVFYSLTTISQTDSLNLVIGKKYKFIMFDDTQVIGKLISEDNTRVNIQTEENITLSLLKSNILYASPDISPEKYSSSYGLFGGVSIIGGGDYYYGYGRSAPVGPSIDVQSVFYFASNKAIRLALNYTHVKPKYNDTYIYASGYPEDIFEGGEITYISFKPGIMLGQFNPKEKAIGYGYGSLGFQFSHRNDLKHTYWSYNYQDTTYTQYTSTDPERTNFNAVLALGGGLGGRLNKNLSIIFEAEINFMLTNSEFSTYFPFRIGVTYSLF